MPLTIDVPEDDLTYLSAAGRDELNASVQRYAEDLLKEAHRLEATRRTHTGEPEVTRTMVKDAYLLLRTQGIRRHKSWAFTFLQICSGFATLAVGGLFDLHSLQADATLLFVFFLVLALAVGLNIVEIVTGRAQ